MDRLTNVAMDEVKRRHIFLTSFLEARNVYNLNLKLNPEGNVCDTLSGGFLVECT
jgi:hypothetical protein